MIDEHNLIKAIQSSSIALQDMEKVIDIIRNQPQANEWILLSNEMPGEKEVVLFKPQHKDYDPYVGYMEAYNG